MKLDHRDFMRVASETGLDGAQAERFWQALADGAAKRPGFDLVHVLYYFGGLIVIGAVSWFMTATWDALGPNGILVMSVLIGAALLALGNTLWRRSEATRVPGGLLIAAAVSTTKDGSLRRPRWGTGAKNGASVSTSKRCRGISAMVWRKSSALLKVEMPEMEM